MKLKFILAAWFVAATAHANKVQVAVAANFTASMKAIVAKFAKDTGHTAKLAFGSCGKGKPAPQALVDYLKTAKARAVIQAYGYELN